MQISFLEIRFNIEIALNQLAKKPPTLSLSSSADAEFEFDHSRIFLLLEITVTMS